MSNSVKLAFIFIGFIALGVWYFLGGMYGWRYPRFRGEFGDDYKKLRYQFFKILFGIIAVITGVAGLVETFIL